MSILGHRVLRREDPKFLTVGGTYVADLALEGSAYLTFVRSSMAHAKIASLDLSAVTAMPGVIGAYTNDDLGLAKLPTIMEMTNEAMVPTVLASGTVRYVGEPIVAIVAETPSIAADALEHVVVVYDPLPVVIDPVAARTDEQLLFPEAGTNVAFALDFGGDDTLFDDCDVVVEATITNQRVAPCPMEGTISGRLSRQRWPSRCSIRLPRRHTQCATPWRALAQPRAGHGPRHRPRRGRWLRCQGLGLPRRHRRGLVRPAPRSARPLDRNTLGEHARSRSRPCARSNT